MAEMIPVRIPQETVNDDEVLIRQWQVNDGDVVSIGQVLAEVETSKSVFEITSPAAGIVHLNVRSGHEAGVGEILCMISAGAAEYSHEIAIDVEQPDAQASLVVEITGASLPSSSKRFSRRALDRLVEMGKSPADFEGQGLIRFKDLDPLFVASNFRLLNDSAANPLLTSPTEKSVSTLATATQTPLIWKSATGVEFDSRQLSRSKRFESKLLSWSSLQAIRSAVSVFVPTLGQAILQADIPDIGTTITSRIIFATSTLLREFPALNSCCLNDEVRHYREVNIGYAIDAGLGLKVAVIRSADLLSPDQIRETRDRLISHYLGEKLQPNDLSGATFTITDLSGAGVTTFDPLISEGQSAILGIGSETGEAPGSNGYELILSFDHRLVEGRLAATFLNRIRQYMMTFERGIREQSLSASHRIEPKCGRCGMPASEAARRQHFLTETVTADWSKRLLCTICLQGR